MRKSVFNKLKLYFELTKPGISRFQVLTVSIGFFLAKQIITFDTTFWYLIISTYLFASSACIGNNIIEKKIDGKMKRTQHRALVQGKVSIKEALLIATIIFSIALYFVLKINITTTILSIATVLIYLFLYTPLKQLSWINTLVGAIPGALPIIGGWVATGTPIHMSIIAMFFSLFSWQMPHFYALSIMYLDDYKIAGYKMLPINDPQYKSTKRQILLFSVLMILSSLYVYLAGFLNIIYFYGILLLSFVFLLGVIKLLGNFSRKNAKKLFILSIIYLPLWFIIIIIDILLSRSI